MLKLFLQDAQEVREVLKCSRIISTLAIFPLTVQADHPLQNKPDRVGPLSNVTFMIK
jgi:hypothetical protein